MASSVYGYAHKDERDDNQQRRYDNFHEVGHEPLRQLNS